MAPCHAQPSPPSTQPPTTAATPIAPPTVYTPRETVQRTPMRVSVLDGRTFRDVGTGATYRLYGIETCEIGQFADLGPQRWPCDVVPLAWLMMTTLNKWVACNTVAEKAGIRQARCASNDFPDMALELLRTGSAVVDVAESGPLIELYKGVEAEAKRNSRGLWGSTFEMPWAYRQRQAAQPDHKPSQP
ncbi:MAG: thermonuclease family protein [Bosea sp. (in: a-proteobacteria)]